VRGDQTAVTCQISSRFYASTQSVSLRTADAQTSGGGPKKTGDNGSETKPAVKILQSEAPMPFFTITTNHGDNN